MSVQNRAIQILSVEDNPADVGILKILLPSAGQSPASLTFLSDGEEALDYLFRRPPFAEATLPDLILLDLNLPKRDGREVLKEIKESAMLKHIPVIVLTTSNSERDISDCYRLGANGFVSKPLDLADFDLVIRSIEMFWLQVADLPTRRKARN